MFFGGIHDSLVSFSIPNGDKFAIDWSTPLISDVYARNQNEQCDDGDDPAIYYPWFGANHMCYDDTPPKSMVRGISCKAADLKWIGQGDRKSRTNMKDMPGFPMIQMSTFDGKKYCGKKIYTKNDLDDKVPLTFRNMEF